MRVLVTDGESRAALAATRSLGRAGHAVFNVGDRRTSLAGASRYSAGRVECPDPSSRPGQFLAAVAEAAGSLAIDVVLPMTEVTTVLLVEGRASLPARCALPFADASAMEAANDKARVLELARELAVPIPATVACANRGEALAAASRQAFPAVIKPARSRVRTAGRWISNRIAYAADPADLLLRLERLPDEAFPVLLQEMIPGPGVGFFTCYDAGRPVASFAHRRIREKPATGGISVLSESIPLPAAAVEYGCKLLDRLSWRGVAMVEFKQDTRDGTLRLMEINGRFWGSLQLAITAGVDFPRILVDIAAGRRPCGAPRGYRHGVRTRWLLGDLDSLFGALRLARASTNRSAALPSRTRTVWDFLHFFGSDLHYEVLTLDDPRPGLLELARWFSQR